MAAITIKGLEFRYAQQAKQPTLHDINLTIQEGSFVAIIGHTGSGKSTLVSLIDGLLKPDSGSITVGRVTVDHNAKASDLNQLRQSVGYVFQFPEQQLFAETVAQDIAFGPTNLGWPHDKIKLAVESALAMVDLPQSFGQRSPFSLSGGQMRRVAIAGVLAMHPSILILDEATAGLDATASARLMNNIKQLHDAGITILMITHQMDQVADFADQVVVINHGQIVKDGTPSEVFANDDFLTANHLAPPAAVQIDQQLIAKGANLDFSLTLPALADQLAAKLREAHHHE